MNDASLHFDSDTESRPEVAPESTGRSWKDGLLTIMLMVFAGCIFWLASGFPDSKDGSPGAAFAPEFLAAVILTLAVLVGIRYLRGRSQDDDATDSGSFRRGIAMVFAFAVYAIAVPHLGFLIATPPFVLGVSYWLGGGLRRAFLTAAVVTAAIFIVFELMLGIRLPVQTVLGS